VFNQRAQKIHWKSLEFYWIFSWNFTGIYWNWKRFWVVSDSSGISVEFQPRKSGAKFPHDPWLGLGHRATP